MPGVALPSILKTRARAFQFDRARLRWPEWVVAGSALVLLLALFVLNWYTITLVSGGRGPKFFIGQSINGWDGVAHLRWLMLVTIVAAFTLFLSQATRRAPAVPVTLSLLVALLGGATTIWLFVRIAIDPPGGRGVGGWVALIAVAVLTWGAFRSLRMEGILPTDAPAQIPTIKLPLGEACSASSQASVPSSPPPADRS